MRWRAICEFTVFLDGEKVSEDVIYAKAIGDRVSVRDVLGRSKHIGNVKIVEVNVNSEKLVLANLRDH